MNAQEIQSSTAYAIAAELHLIPLANAVGSDTGHRHCPPPVGYQNGRGRCPECGSGNLIAVLSTPTSSVIDPDICCLLCGNTW